MPNGKIHRKIAKKQKIALLSHFQGGQRKRHQKITLLSLLFTISVPCTKIRGGYAPPADAHGNNAYFLENVRTFSIEIILCPG